MAAGFTVQDAAGEVVASGVVDGGPVEVAEGVYQVVVETTGESIITQLTDGKVISNIKEIE